MNPREAHAQRALRAQHEKTKATTRTRVAESFTPREDQFVIVRIPATRARHTKLVAARPDDSATHRQRLSHCSEELHEQSRLEAAIPFVSESRLLTHP